MSKKSNSLFLTLISCVLAACACISPPEKGKVDLTPKDPRPVFSITVADGDEVALLEKELNLKPLYFRESTVYFHEAPGLIDRLKELGYAATKEDPYQVYRRVVRVAKKGSEKELLRTGVRLINRERDYWVIEGNLGQLTALGRIGYRLSAIGSHEPRPREVKITVRSPDEVAWLNALQVDIFTVRETKEGIVVYGGAFDYQIDHIQGKNLKIELINTVGKGEKR